MCILLNIFIFTNSTYLGICAPFMAVHNTFHSVHRFCTVHIGCTAQAPSYMQGLFPILPSSAPAPAKAKLAGLSKL